MLCEIFGIICYFFVVLRRRFFARFAKSLDTGDKLGYNENRNLCARAERRDCGNELE